MRWRFMTDENGNRDTTRAVSDSDYRVTKDAPDSFLAWGPNGSQDISYIQANTAAHIRKLWREDMQAEKVECVAGRGFIGIFTSGAEAQRACDEHAATTGQGGEEAASRHTGVASPRPSPAARTTDPESSHEADRHMDASGKRECQQRAVLEAVRANSGLTSKHLAQRTGLDRHMVGRRLPELERDGLVRRGPVVNDPDDGRQGVTWWRVDEPAQGALI